MGIISEIRKRKTEMMDKHRLNKQVKAEMKAREMEKEAKYQQKMYDRLQRQEKTEQIIKKSKKLQFDRSRLGKITQKIKKNLKQAKKRKGIFARSSGKNIFTESSGFNPVFHGTTSTGNIFKPSNKKGKKKGIFEL